MSQHTRETIEIPACGTAGPVVHESERPSLHDDPHRIHQLLDRLGLPPGTVVRVTTVAASVIVR